jgi:multidrug efflux system membrane fusion protein
MNQATTRNSSDSVTLKATEESPSTRPRRRRLGWLLGTTGILLVAGGAWWLLRGNSGQSPGSTSSTPQAARAVPVVAVASRSGDLPIYLDGLGTVIAFSTVTIRTRVDGQLVKIAFAEGQLVHEGDVLAEIDSRTFEVQLAQAQGQLARDEALLKNARLDLQRYQDASAAVPKQQVDTAASTVSQYEAALQVDQSQIDSAKLQLTYCRILSPITGKIGLRLVDQGNMVHASDPNGLAVITQVQPIAIQFSLPQDDLPRVRRAMTAGEVTVDAYDRDLRNRLSTGKLLAMDSQIDSSTGTVRLKAVFSNQDEALFPNQFVNARLLVDTRRSAVLVPAAAVQRNAQSMFVYVVKPDETVETRTVTLGPTEGDTTSIVDGLAAGEVVVTDGVDKLQQGTKVAVRDARGDAAGGHGDPAKDPSKKKDSGGPAR